MTAAERTALISQSPLAGRYDKPVDRESAYEMLVARKVTIPSVEPDAPAAAGDSLSDKAGDFLGSVAGKALKSAMQQAANQLGRQLVRGLMGSLLGSSKKRR
ncbi:hypothetical protein D9M73_228240 [compost metagenome]